VLQRQQYSPRAHGSDRHHQYASNADGESESDSGSGSDWATDSEEEPAALGDGGLLLGAHMRGVQDARSAAAAIGAQLVAGLRPGGGEGQAISRGSQQQRDSADGASGSGAGSEDRAAPANAAAAASGGGEADPSASAPQAATAKHRPRRRRQRPAFPLLVKDSSGGIRALGDGRGSGQPSALGTGAFLDDLDQFDPGFDPLDAFDFDYYPDDEFGDEFDLGFDPQFDHEDGFDPFFSAPPPPRADFDRSTAAAAGYGRDAPAAYWEGLLDEDDDEGAPAGWADGDNRQDGLVIGDDDGGMGYGYYEGDDALIFGAPYPSGSPPAPPAAAPAAAISQCSSATTTTTTRPQC